MMGAGDLTRRGLIAMAAAFLGKAALAGAPSVSLRPVLRGHAGGHADIGGLAEVVQAAKLRGAVSCAVADVLTAQPLEDYQGDMHLPPASVAKAITALYALDVLGAEHRFPTRLLATGPVRDGVLDGDLILAGGGDPTLDSDALAALAQQMQAAGISGVSGSFLVYDAALPRQTHIDPSQPEHVAYNPAVAGLALNYNRVHFEWHKAAQGYDTRLEARARQNRPTVHSSQMQITDRASPVYGYKNNGRRDEWSVARTALGAGGGRWLPVRQPGLYAGDVFATLAGQYGVSLRAARLMTTLPADASVLAQHQSAPLIDILRRMLRYSTNLTAEMLGAAASVRQSGAVNDLRSSATQMNTWARQRLNMRDPGLVDHSGLSDQSRLSANDMVRGLIAAQSMQTLRPLLKSFGLRDANGRPDKTHPIKVDAKTGTLHFVSGLGGYMTARNGAVMAFAIFSADAQTRAGLSKAEREAPKGARSWNRKAKSLQQKLIEHWGARFGA